MGGCQSLPEPGKFYRSEEAKCPLTLGYGWVSDSETLQGKYQGDEQMLSSFQLPTTWFLHNSCLYVD